jgi:hypothetical protein
MNESGASSSTDAAAYALVHTLSGLGVGLSIHALVPVPAADESVSETVSYVALQALLNGVAVYVSTQLLDGQNDPTSGVLFLWALMSSQPGFTERLKLLTSAVADTPWSAAASLFRSTAAPSSSE